MTDILSIIFIVSLVALFVVSVLSEIDALPEWLKTAQIWAVWILALSFLLTVYAGVRLGQAIDRRMRR